MKIFFASESIEAIRQNEEKVGAKLSNINGFRKKLTDLLEDGKNFVFICNESQFAEHNEISARFIFDALNDNGLNFENYIVLDEGNKDQAEEILQNADFVYLQGGTIFVQNQFLKDIKNDFEERFLPMEKQRGTNILVLNGLDNPENNAQLVVNEIDDKENIIVSGSDIDLTFSENNTETSLYGIALGSGKWEISELDDNLSLFPEYDEGDG